MLTSLLLSLTHTHTRNPILALLTYSTATSLYS